VPPSSLAALAAAFPVVDLSLSLGHRVPALPPLPALRKLRLTVSSGSHKLATAQPSLTAADVAPSLREVDVSFYCDGEDKAVGSTRFWSALAGVTRVATKHDTDGPGIYVESGAGGVGVSGLSAVTSLRELSLHWDTFNIPLRGVFAGGGMDDDDYEDEYEYGVGMSAVLAKESDILTRLPKLPCLTRLTARAGVRFSRFEKGTLPSLRVLDLRGGSAYVYVDQSSDVHTQEEIFNTPVFPAFADGALPALQTLLLGFRTSRRERGLFSMTDLLRLPPSIRVVVIEYAHCHVALAGTVRGGAPDALAARVRGALARAALHWHDCEFGEKREYSKQTVPKSADLPAGPEQTMVAALRGGAAKWCECVDGCSVCTLLEAGWGDDVRKEAEVEEG
jgi:hypothetical protein